ncbi:ABC transporter substrate-binding protein [Actinocrispum wychmicini]|uniref:NitT/TauT family transport system substrate-binding protein n=1 Tax=Actinocrispum wychmicini TaxID=1213861 RepID=A0A4R2JL25_9PSEU|nr:ABC transporter substrate-binding protein [Actinocrispum wychmicini]TCO60721.1 NitT/TauT family transport system substrate-binding protein [Actinocrispum wychmicini]
MRRSLGAVRIGRLVAAALAVTVMAGCSALGGSDSSSGGNAQVEKSKVKVAIIPQLIDIVGYERAKSAGYFKNEGLEIDEVAIKSATDAVPQFKSDQLDFAFGNWTTFIEAQAHKAADLVLVIDAQQAKEGMTALCALPDSGIRTPKDLAGKAIGVNALKSNVELTTRAVLQANDVDPNSVQFKVIPTSNALNALQTKQIPVMSLQEPNLTVAKQTLGVVVVADRATGPVADFPIAGYATSAKFAKANPRTVAAFQRAMAKGQGDVADRQTLESTLLSYGGVDQNIVKLVVIGFFPTSIDRTRLQRVADLMQTYGILTEKFDVGPMIYQAPVP